MKKTNKFAAALAFAACLLSAVTRAQLSGVYTINSGAPASSTNYQSFTDLAADLNTSGITGPVTVNVVASSGPYNEQVEFTGISGTSSTNTITINGNSNVLSYASSSSSQPWTLCLNGADYMFFNNLQVEGTGSYALVCHLWNQADNNQFSGCSFICPANSTSSSQIPVSLSGSGTSYASSGNAGNNNSWISCNMHWGWSGVTFYTWSSSPYNTGNQVIDCSISDFSTYGFYNRYARSTVFTGNTLERPMRNNSSTTYGVYFVTTSGALVEGNRIQNLYDADPGSTSSTYGIYFSGSASSTSPNEITNNIISVDGSNGTIYAMYLSSASYYHVYHNTISLDDANAGGTGSVRGIYATGGTGTSIRNNLISITHSGAGNKHCLYYTSSSFASDYNVLYINSLNGNNNVGYYSGDYATLASWQSANSGSWDQSSLSADPVFSNENANIFLPNSYVINDMCTPVGVAQDIVNFTRSTTQPDPGAREFLNVPCSGLSLTTSAVAPAGMICPNSEVFLGLSHTLTNSGITYQWQYSTASPFGPFTALTGATLPFLSTNTINTTTYFNAVITCTNGGANINSLADTVLVAPPITDTIPYFESFESIAATNRLPNCSWYSSNLGSTALTYTIAETNGRVPRTGNNYASFYYSPADSNYFYTNGLWLKPGVTYSAALWYRTEYYGYSNWSDLSILIGSSQSPAGLTTIASSNGPAVSNVYKLLSGTFTVSSAGLYHLAIRGTANGSGAQYLTWDDLSVTIPCALNSPTIIVSSSSSVACSGTPVFLNAAGADSYLWSNGSTGSAITVHPLVSGYYSVTGTSTLSGCAVNGQQYIFVNPSPQVGAYASEPAVCAGQPVTLSALGASTYTWNTGSLAQHITVSLPASANFTVMGSNQYGCSGSAVVQVTVNPLPVITASPGALQYCTGDEAVLTAAGAATYSWNSGAAFLQTGNPLTITAVPASYTVRGTDVNGCVGTAFLALNVSECTSLREENSVFQVKIYPNPASNLVNVQSAGNSAAFHLFDLTGRALLKGTCTDGHGTFNVSDLPAGVYMFRLDDGSAPPVRIIKE